VIGIASEDSALAPVIGFLLCVAFLHLFSERPFKGNEDSTLGIVLTYSLAFIFLGALLIKVDAQPDGDLERSIFEIVLIFLLLMGPGIIAIESLWSFFSRNVDDFMSFFSRNVDDFKAWTMSALPTARRGSIEMRRRKRQVSLFRTLHATDKPQRRFTLIDSYTKSVQGGPAKFNSHDTQLGVSTPSTTISLTAVDLVRDLAGMKESKISRDEAIAVENISAGVSTSSRDGLGSEKVVSTSEVNNIKVTSIKDPSSITQDAAKSARDLARIKESRLPTNEVVAEESISAGVSTRFWDGVELDKVFSICKEDLNAISIKKVKKGSFLGTSI
jgi:hypothetical protein